MAWIKNNSADKVGATETVVSRTAIVPATADFSSLTALSKLILNPANLGLQGLYVKATDFISRLMYVPFNPTSIAGDYDLTLFNITSWLPEIDTNIPIKLINLRQQLYNLGQIQIDRYFNNFADFNGYTKIDVYLPFVGFVSVNPNDVMGKWLQIRLGFDVLSGQGTYYIGVTDNRIDEIVSDDPVVPDDVDDNTRILSTHISMLGSEIPLGITNAGDISRNLLLGAVKVTGTALAYKSGLEAGEFNTKSHTKTVKTIKRKNTKTDGRLKITGKDTTIRDRETDTSGSHHYSMKNECFNTSLSALSSMHLEGNSDKPNSLLGLADGSKYVYVVIYRPNLEEVSYDYGHLYGYPTGKVKLLDNVRGYTEISAIHLEGSGFATATQEEMIMLEEVLSNGCIFPSEQLKAPTISLNGDIISIANNNTFDVYYTIYVDGIEKTTTTFNSFDLKGLNLETGNYNIYVTSVLQNYSESEPSNTVIYVVENEDEMITDLTGYTVTVPAGWSADAGYGLFDVIGTASYTAASGNYYENYQFDTLNIGYFRTSSIADIVSFSDIGYEYSTSPDSSFTLTFTGGDTSNSSLIQWLYDNNATFEKTLISFTITKFDDVTTTYQSEYDMTWGEWVESEYNTDGYQIINDNIYANNPNEIVGYSASDDVKINDKIIENYNYYTGHSGGAN